MEIAKKSFSDGFSWVQSALRLCLSKAPAFIVLSVLASIVLTVLVLTLGLVFGRFAKIQVLIIIAIAVAIVLFVLSLGFLIRAIQTMIDNNKVTFGSFFFALFDKKFLIKIIPFAIIISLAMPVVSSIIVYLCYLACSSISMFWRGSLYLLVMALVGTYATYALILFVQRNNPKMFSTFSDTAKGLTNNILPVVGMYIGLVAVGIVVNVICQIYILTISVFRHSSSIESIGFDATDYVLLLIILVLQCIYAMLSLTSICISSKEIFVENDVEENVETEKNTDSENQQ